MTENARIKPIEEATNKSWSEWLQFMKDIHAKDLTHHEIATKVFYELEGKLDNPGWWAQSVTVAYEQDSGRRVPGQSPDGTFQTSVSKSTKLGMQALMDAWTTFAAQDKVVQEYIAGDLKVGGTENRLTWRTKAQDGSSITIISEPKKNGTAAIVVQLLGLKSLELNTEAKEKWVVIVERFLKTL